MATMTKQAPTTDPHITTAAIRRYLRERREELGWAQVQITDALGMGSDSLIVRLERGYVKRSKHLPTILGWLESGELPPPPGEDTLGACNRCQILLYASEEELPAGAIGIQVATAGGYCRACEKEMQQ